MIRHVPLYPVHVKFATFTGGDSPKYRMCFSKFGSCDVSTINESHTRSERGFHIIWSFLVYFRGILIYLDLFEFRLIFHARYNNPPILIPNKDSFVICIYKNSIAAIHRILLPVPPPLHLSRRDSKFRNIKQSRTNCDQS